MNLQKLLNQYIIKIILFGSVACGDDTEESDIDILIVSNHPIEIDDRIADEIAWIMHVELPRGVDLEDSYFTGCRCYCL